MASVEIPATVVAHGVHTTLVGGTSCISSDDGATSYMQQAQTVTSGTSGFNDNIAFPPTAIPGVVSSVSLVTVSKGNDGTGTGKGATTFRLNVGSWGGIFADTATDWTEIVTPLRVGGSEVVTQAMLEDGDVHYNPGSALLNGVWLSPLTAMLQWTYIALRVEYVPDGCYTVDLPAYGAIAPYGGTREDTIATPDTSTEIVIGDVFQDIAVGTYGTAYDAGANVVLPTIPSGMSVTDIRYVTIAYRESGDGGPANEPFLYLDSGARSGQYLLDNLPIGGYAGELVSEFTESLSYLQLDHPLNRAWLSYSGGTPPPIHVAYLAIRLTICPVKAHAPPLRQFPPNGNGRGPKRIYPRTANRRAGKSY